RQYTCSIHSTLFQLTNTASNTFIFFFNASATTEIYTLSLHDALPISFAKRAYFCMDRIHGERRGNSRLTLVYAMRTICRKLQRSPAAQAALIPTPAKFLW